MKRVVSVLFAAVLACTAFVSHGQSLAPVKAAAAAPALPPIPPDLTQEQLRALYSSLSPALQQALRARFASLTPQQRQYLIGRFRDLPVSNG